MANAELPVDQERSRGIVSGIWRRFKATRLRSRMRSRAQVRFRLSREGIHFLGVLLFIFIGAVIREINLLILLAGSMIGLLILQWRFNSRTLIGIDVKRRLLGRVAVAQKIDAQLAVLNPKSWLGAWLIMIEDPIKRQAPYKKLLSKGGVALADEVGPKQTRECKYQLQFMERGKYSVGPSLVSTRFPIGLGIGWKTINNECDVVVHPKLGTLAPIARTLFQEQQQGHSTTSHRVGAHEAEFFGLRPWASGDSKRWIHWRTSARLGELSVRQFELQQHKQVCVLLDLWSPNDPAKEADEQCEKAISALATIAVHLTKSGRLAAAVAGEEVFSASEIQSSVLLNDFMDQLSVIRASSDPDLAQAMKEILLPLINVQHLLVISTRPDQSNLLAEVDNDMIFSKALARINIRWINVSAGEMEPYISWT